MHQILRMTNDTLLRYVDAYPKACNSTNWELDKYHSISVENKKTIVTKYRRIIFSAIMGSMANEK